MIYQAFTCPVPKNQTKKALHSQGGDLETMTAFAMVLVDMANRHIDKYQDNFGHEPDTLLVPANAPIEQLEAWFGDVLQVKVISNPDDMFGVTRR